MSNELSIIKGTKSVATIKGELKEWKPPTDQAAADLKKLVSVLGSKDGKAAVAAADERLARKCENCDELVFEGVTLKAVRKSIRTYKQTKGVKEAQAALDDLLNEKKNLDDAISIAKKALELEQEKGGFTKEDIVFSHWLVQ